MDRLKYHMASGDISHICPVCKIFVNDNDRGVQCEIFCGNWFHCACVSISKEEYKSMSRLAEKSKWACEPCDFRLSKVASQLKDIDGFINLSVTVSNLIAVVKDVINDNIALNAKVDEYLIGDRSVIQQAWNKPDVGDLQTTTTSASETTSSSRATELSNPSSDNTLVGEDSTDMLSRAATVSSDDETSTSVDGGSRLNCNDRLLYSDVLLTKSKRDADSDSDLTGPKKVKSVCRSSDTTNFRLRADRNTTLGTTRTDTVVNTAVKREPRRVKARPIIGTNECDDNCKIKAVGKYEWIFVTRLDPCVTKVDLEEFVNESGVKSECVELKAKHSSYKSFKVGVIPNLVSKILCPSFWPNGTLVRKFVPKRNTVLSPTFLGKRPDTQSVP